MNRRLLRFGTITSSVEYFWTQGFQFDRTVAPSFSRNWDHLSFDPGRGLCFLFGECGMREMKLAAEPVETHSSENRTPILTIAVPTYNRSANLALLLKNLGPQLTNEPRVELIISDNSSPDNTPAVIESFVASGLRCRYIRNRENVGPDGNFLQCYAMASGKYLWIFSDDDVILPGTVDTILRLIEDQDFDLVYMRPLGFIRDPTERGQVNPRPKTKVLSDASAFVHAVGLNGDFALISSVIVNKQRIEAVQHRPFEDGRNTNLIQLSWIFTALNNFRRGLFVQRGLYAVCEENPSRPFDVAKIFGVNWYNVSSLFLGIGSEVHNAVLNDQLYSWFPTYWYGLSKSARLTQTAPPHSLMRPIYGKRPLYWLCVYPLLKLPRLLAGGWLAVLRGIRKVDRAWHAP